MNILLENRMFADVIKLSWGHTLLGWAEIQCDLCPYKKGHPMKTNACKKTAMWLRRQRPAWSLYKLKDAKGFWQPPEVRRGWEGSPTCSRGGVVPPCLGLGLPALTTVRQCLSYTLKPLGRCTLSWQLWGANEVTNCDTASTCFTDPTQRPGCPRPIPIGFSTEPLLNIPHSWTFISLLWQGLWHP